MRAQSILAAIAAPLIMLGCRPDANPTGIATAISASRDADRDPLASPIWQATTATLVAQANLQPVGSAHGYSLVGVAQYLAVQRAEGDNGGRDAEDEGLGRGQRVADRGAVAGASAAVLSYLFPTKTQQLEDMVTAERSDNPPGLQRAFARGEAIGRAVGADIVARAQADGFSNPFTGTIPLGPGYWVSNTTPPTVAGGQLPGVRPWFLTSANQFRPGPPPAFGSADFLKALGEVRHISDTRTAEQIQIAAYWALNAGTVTTPGFWLQVGTDGINSHGLSEHQATHLYALLSATMFDAQIGCWDAKETYWFIRPWQADPAIATVPAVGKPNHPSYPSGHSCLSSAAAAVLESFFPEETAQLDAMVIEAGLSRIYGGIHYRFDIEAAQRLGRSVGAFAIAADRSGQSVLSPESEAINR